MHILQSLGFVALRHRHSARYGVRQQRCLILEQLEQRLVLAPVVWDGEDASNSFLEGKNWVGDSIPAPADTAIFRSVPNPGPFDVKVVTGATVHTVFVDGVTARFDLGNDLDLTPDVTLGPTTFFVSGGGTTVPPLPTFANLFTPVAPDANGYGLRADEVYVSGSAAPATLTVDGSPTLGKSYIHAFSNIHVQGTTNTGLSSIFIQNDDSELKTEGNIYISKAAGQNGQIVVQGKGVDGIKVEGDIFVGGNGRGSLIVKSGEILTGWNATASNGVYVDRPKTDTTSKLQVIRSFDALAQPIGTGALTIELQGRLHVGTLTGYGFAEIDSVVESHSGTIGNPQVTGSFSQVLVKADGTGSPGLWRKRDTENPINVTDRSVLYLENGTVEIEGDAADEWQRGKSDLLKLEKSAGKGPGGILAGNGSLLGSLESIGTIRPGDSYATGNTPTVTSAIGSLTVNGNVTLRSGSIVDAEISGTVNLESSDQIIVTDGVADGNKRKITLGGLLKVKGNAFTAAEGYSVDLITADTIEGEFANLTRAEQNKDVPTAFNLLPNIGNNLRWRYKYHAEGGQEKLTLFIVKAPLADLGFNRPFDLGYDSAGGDNPGSFEGLAYWQSHDSPGASYNAHLTFDDVPQSIGPNRLSIDNTPSLAPGTDSWTLSTWIRSDSVGSFGSTEPLYSHYGAVEIDWQPIGSAGSREITYSVSDVNGAGSVSGTAGIDHPLVSLTWTHVALTIDRALGEAHLWINGEKIAASQTTIPSNWDISPTDPAQNPTLTMKGESFIYNGTSLNRGGDFDDFRIYNTALSSEALSSVYPRAIRSQAILGIFGTVSDLTVDLPAFFSGSIDDSAGLSFSLISNSNPQLATPTLDTGTEELTVSYATSLKGIADIIVEATNPTGDVTQETIHIVIGNSSPDLADTEVKKVLMRDEILSENDGWLIDDLVDGFSDFSLVVNEGIAVTAVDSAFGSFEYRLTDVDPWLPISPVDEEYSLLLPADGEARMRLILDSPVIGELDEAITFAAWDGTTGTPGTLADASYREAIFGGITPFSYATDSLNVIVTPFAPSHSLSAGGGLNFAASTAIAADGRYAVARVDTDFVVRVQRYDVDGTPAGNAIDVGSFGGGPPSNVAIDMDDSGNFVVAWSDATVIRVRQYDAQGTPLGDAETVSDTGPTYYPFSPSIAIAPNGNQLAVWTQPTATEMDVMASLFDSVAGSWSTPFMLHDDAAGEQETSRVGSAIGVDGQSNFIVTWHSFDYPNETAVVEARRLLPDGTLQPMFEVSTDPTQFAMTPSIATDLAGNSTIVWRNVDKTTFESEIVQRRYDPGDVALDASDVIVEPDVGVDMSRFHLTGPAVSIGGFGGTLVTWVDTESDPWLSETYHSFAQWFDVSGSPFGSVFQVDYGLAGYAGQTPDIDANSMGTFAVGWWQEGDNNSDLIVNMTATLPFMASVSNVSDTVSSIAPAVATAADGRSVTVWVGDDFTVWAQMYGSDGTATGAAIDVGTTGALPDDITVDMDDNGNFAVAWVDSDSTAEVMVRRYDSAGVALGNAEAVSTSASPSDPMVVMAPNGDIFVAWNTYSSLQFDVMGVLFDSVAGTWGAEFMLNATTVGDQQLSGVGNSVVVDSTGEYIVTWQSYDYANVSMIVAARRFEADGTANPAEILVSNDPARLAMSPTIAVDGSDNYTIAWRNANSTLTDSDIVFRRYDDTDSAIDTSPAPVFTSAGLLIASGLNSGPTVAMAGDGSFVIAWTGTLNGSSVMEEFHAYAQWYDATGTALGSLYQIDEGLDGYVLNAPHLDVDSAGNVVFVWLQEDDIDEDEVLQRWAFAN